MKNARRSYSDDTVSRAKAMAICGISTKRIASLLGIPFNVVSEWRYGPNRPKVPPDTDFITAYNALMHSERA